jgi:hypothetical protein
MRPACCIDELKLLIQVNWTIAAHPTSCRGKKIQRLLTDDEKGQLFRRTLRLLEAVGSRLKEEVRSNGKGLGDTTTSHVEWGTCA